MLKILVLNFYNDVWKEKYLAYSLSEVGPHKDTNMQMWCDYSENSLLSKEIFFVDEVAKVCPKVSQVQCQD